MQKDKKILLFLIPVLAVVLILSSCNYNPAKITMEKASIIAQTHFQELYKKNIAVEKVEYKRVSQNRYLNLITVFNEETKYELILDENNKPLADNYSNIEAINNINLASLYEEIEPLGLIFNQNYDIYTVFNNLDRKYIVSLSVVSIDIPNKDFEDRIFSLLNTLRVQGIDELSIVVNTPEFLLPKKELELGIYGLQLYAEFFKTDLDLKSYEKQYGNFTNNIFWDKKKFYDEMFKLAQLGYENVYFYIAQVTAATVEISLYCESVISLDDKQAAALLNEMDDSYFRIGKKETKYALLHVYI